MSVNSRPGITLIELIIALCAASIIITAAAVILIFGQNSLDRGWQQVNVHRDASYSMLRIKQAIRCATKAQLEEEGKAVKIYYKSGWIKYRFVPDQKDLLYQFEAEDEQVLLDGIVESAAFSINPANPNAITVNLELKKDDYEVEISSTTMMRNYGS